MAGAGADNGSTILDYLNEDCWRAVLAYVPVQDIVRSEHTSRRWQEIVLVYLQSVRLCIVPPHLKDRETHRNGRSLVLRSNNYSSLESWTKKLSPSVVAVYCDSEDSLEIIDNCPNLEVVTFIGLRDNALLEASLQTGNLKHLRWVIFMRCPVSDHCISQFLAHNALQQLEINNNNEVTGQCLMNIHAKTLKTLVLKQCDALQASYLLSAAEHHLSELTKLLLIDVPKVIYNNVLLDTMPQLECLYKIVQEYGFVKTGDNIFTRVSRLSQLKYLYVAIQKVTDQDLELVTRHCKELRVLWLRHCEDVTRRGVAAVCNNAGERLVALDLGYCRQLRDDDVMLIVRSCPNLKALDVYVKLSAQLRARVAAERRELGRGPLLLPTGWIYEQMNTDKDYAQELKKRYPELESHYHEFKDQSTYGVFWNPE